MSQSPLMLAHLEAMQGMATAYLVPEDYRDREGKITLQGDNNNTEQWKQGQRGFRAEAFAGDMLWMLDGPEQRAAQAELSFDYIAETDVTASDVYGGENSDAVLLASDLRVFIDASKALDKHKKVLFRKRSNELAGLPEPGPFRTIAYFGRHGDNDAELLHGIIGVATESGELAEIALKRLTNGGESPVDKVNVREEIGDVLWYLARMCKWAATDFLTEMRRNIAKLRERHGSAFNAERDANRDLAAERQLLEDDDAYTFDAEQVEAGQARQDIDPSAPGYDPNASRVKTQAVDFPDEMISGVDPMAGKFSDGR